MDFYGIVRQILEQLHRDGRTTYRALKHQFNLNDDALEDLKEELFFAHPVVDEDGRGMVWTGEANLPPGSDARHEPDLAVRFHAILPVLTMLLQREGQVTYRTLIQVFGLDEALLNDLCQELAFRGLAIDKDCKGLVWTGDTQGAGMIEPPETISTDVPSKVLPIVSEPAQSAPEAERRQLTVMFCDLADSTRLSQQLDPENLREVIRAYQATAAGVIEQYEGHMAQYLGDGLLIYFGWPVAHEDDAQRAAYAGLGIVEAITTTLNPRLEQEKGIQLTVRLGIHTGPVVVGKMGGGGRHENLATGETVNIAARLEGLAKPDTVIISDVTARLLRDAFELDDLGAQVLKGVAEPMDVFGVTRPLDIERDDEADLPSEGVFLVGRDEEVGLLLRRWEQSKEGPGQVVMISGEAGIGKSSLLVTVRHHVVGEAHARMTFRCSPYHANSALYPVIEHVQRALQFQPGDTPATKLDKLERVLGGYSRPLAEVVPLYAALLSVPAPEERYAALTLSPPQQRQQTQDALVGWLLEEAERQPTLAMWEDLHWADPSTLELLGLVLEQTPTVPMLHVLTFRPEFEPPWPSRSHMTPVTLNRLERVQVEALISRMAQGKALPAEVVEHIVGKTDGVPLYVEELTKMLLASGLLNEEANAYVLTGPLSTVTIPDTLQDSLMARLDQMNAAKEVAQLGAVLGREFSYDMLLAISSQDDTTLQASLVQLVGAELLYQRGRPPRARYLFKHALIQDAAYASLLRSTRQQVHQRIAECFEERFPETVVAQPELVAYHYTEANCPEQALPYWQRAGEHAAQHSAYAEAISHLSKGLDMLLALPDLPEKVQQELNIQVALGPLLMATQGFAAPEVGSAYNRAYELCQQVKETSRLFPTLWGLWLFNHVRAEYQTALGLGEQLLSLAQRMRDLDLVLQAHHALETTFFSLGEFATAVEHMEKCLALYDSQKHHSHASLYGGHDPGVCCLSFSALAHWFLGYPDQALARIHEALALAEELAHPNSLAYALQRAAYLAQLRGEAQIMFEKAERLRLLATEHAFADLIASEMVIRGCALAMYGQSREGISQMRQGLGALQATGRVQTQPRDLALLAASYVKTNQIDDGLTAVSAALELIDKIREGQYEAELYRLKGELLLLQSSDNQTEAETCFHQAISIARSQQAKSWELRAATSLARLWQSQGKRQDAYELLAPVYGWFTEGFDTADLKDAEVLLRELEG